MGMAGDIIFGGGGAQLLYVRHKPLSPLFCLSRCQRAHTFLRRPTDPYYTSLFLPGEQAGLASSYFGTFPGPAILKGNLSIEPV